MITAAMLSTSFSSRYDMNVETLTLEEILELADATLASNDSLEAIKLYEKGISRINPDEDSLLTSLSFFTNLGTAYSSVGNERKAVEFYRNAIVLFSDKIEEHDLEESSKKSATDITAQAAFFLGMTHEELENYRKAADSYAFAASLDPQHWAGELVNQQDVDQQ